MLSDEQRRAWEQALLAKKGGKGSVADGRSHGHAGASDEQGGKARPQMGAQSGKGIGPNKASGHKGGISRQGSKRV